VSDCEGWGFADPSGGVVSLHEEGPGKGGEITAFIAKMLKEDQDERTRRDNLLESTAENER